MSRSGAPDLVLPPSRTEEAHRETLARALGDDYELGRLLGRGGFAEVYAARDRALQRDVAVKTLRFDLALTPVLAERFQREAQAMARLRHPNLMPVYSVGRAEGIAFFVMPLALGETLREVLERERRLPVEEARRILSETAAALAEAHRAGMVHRDVKPDNIILEGDERRVLLMDLGIAKAAVASESAELTGTGMIIGTPHYMSPEQASGERHVDHRADLYSLGVVGFQMLTGRLPFTAPTVQGVIVKQISEEAPPVSGLRQDCPKPLADAVARLLAKEPALRFGSAAELLAALEGGGSTRVSARLSGALGIADPATADPVTRYRWLLAAFGAVTLVAWAVDLLHNGAVDFAPLVMAAGLLPLAFRYTGLWMEGVTWRDVLGRGTRPSSRTLSPATPSAGTSGTGTFGAHAPAVHRIRSERAILLGHVARIPRAERAHLPDVVGAADRLVTRARALGRQLARLDQLVAQSGQRRTGAVSPVNARAVQEAETKRGALEREMESAAAAMEALRQAVELAVTAGVAGASADLEVTVEKAESRARVGGVEATDS